MFGSSFEGTSSSFSRCRIVLVLLMSEAGDFSTKCFFILGAERSLGTLRFRILSDLFSNLASSAIARLIVLPTCNDGNVVYSELKSVARTSVAAYLR